MNVESVQTECTVSGTLSFILAITRVFGIAPLKFERVHDGWRISVSHKWNLYGKIMVIILMFFSATALIADLTVDTETSVRAKTNSNRFVLSLDVIIVSLTALAAAFTGEKRMHQTIDCIAKLAQMHKELNRHQEPTDRGERKKLFLVIFMLIFACVVMFVEYGVFIRDVVASNGKVLTSSFYIFYNISYMVLTLYVIQFTLIVMLVLTYLQLLNNCLRNLLQEIYNDSVKQAPATLHRLASLYCSLCNMVRQLDDSNGLALVLLHLSFLLHLIITSYHLFTEAYRGEPHHLFILLTIGWTVFHLAKIIMIIESCHRTHEQLGSTPEAEKEDEKDETMKQVLVLLHGFVFFVVDILLILTINVDLTKKLVNQMRRYTPPNNFAVISELKWFERHLMLNEVTYSPMQIFTMDRSLLVTILGSITTYLVVVIQL